MKMVFALTGATPAQVVLGTEKPPNVLCSQLWIKSLDQLPYTPSYVLLDSGAFSAWNAGTPVQLGDYLLIACRIQKQWPDAHIINLDVIPGEAGRTATRAEIEQGMAQSLRNADELRAKELRCMEVFHQDEPFSFLDQLVNRREAERDVIGLSPRNDVSVKQRCTWLVGVLGHLVRKHGVKGLPRFHGLAATGRDMLTNFPFYSADSSSWVNPYRYGIMVNEKGRGGKIVDSGQLPSTRSKVGADLMARRSIRNLRKLEADITRLWEKRGVVWNDN